MLMQLILLKTSTILYTVATILFYFSMEMEHKNQILFLEVTYKFKISVYWKDILSVNFVIIHIIIIKSSLKNFSY